MLVENVHESILGLKKCIVKELMEGDFFNIRIKISSMILSILQAHKGPQSRLKMKNNTPDTLEGKELSKLNGIIF